MNLPTSGLNFIYNKNTAIKTSCKSSKSAWGNSCDKCCCDNMDFATGAFASVLASVIATDKATPLSLFPYQHMWATQAELQAIKCPVHKEELLAKLKSYKVEAATLFALSDGGLPPALSDGTFNWIPCVQEVLENTIPVGNMTNPADPVEPPKG